ncbi:hypothetical protein QAD02_015406 [Eretmocerus hayati]|uniref:Uncharacterized protein n=1 Tax=Eretmocerus hayati TaxID=131215 RepID=A0ACC2P8L4_9HYME|nr:hypothetical protein QAD02_015406 [Eretmocerus hayati]
METGNETIPDDDTATKKSRKKRKGKSRWTVKKGGKSKVLRAAVRNEQSSNESKPETPKTKIQKDYSKQKTSKEERISPNNKGKSTLRVNELISEEEKKQIESYYNVDLSSVDKKKVEDSIYIDDKTYRCELCQTAYPRLDKCQVHVWRHYNMLPYVCLACDFKTLTVTSMRGHIRKFHLRLKPFKCDQCDKSFAVNALLREHKIIHVSSQPYKCDSCDFACLNKRVLVTHMTKHKAVKDILCDICGKAFYATKKMRAHRNTHQEANAFKCEICHAYVSSEKALSRHHAFVHVKEYTCQICNKKCTTRKTLQNHRYQVHSSGRYHCDLCGNVYKNYSMLQDHILKHQGIRKYKCEICGKSFAQRTHLTTHMAVHDSKRHECPGCHKAFNRQDNMKVHTKNCAKFQANPELAKLLPDRRFKEWSHKRNNSKLIFNDEDAVDITVPVEPTLNPEVTIKVEPLDDIE